MFLNLKSNLREAYNPLYFLGALGAGGLCISFYMYLHFMVDHPGRPFAVYEFVWPLVEKMDSISFLIIGCFIIMFYLAYVHFRLLIWNIMEYRLYIQTPAYEQLRNSNAEATLMAIPLTLSMTVNVFFIFGAVFVPNIWSEIQNLFPLSLGAFFIIGIYALVILLRYVVRIITTNSFDFGKNNNLSQLIIPFSLSMIGVGFTAPAAMSTYFTVRLMAAFCAIFFMILTVATATLILNNGFKNILEHGLAKEAAVSLWTMIPILTLLGISMFRLMHAFYNWGIYTKDYTSGSFAFLMHVVTEVIQLIFLIIGGFVMQNIGYFEKYIFGPAKSVPSLAIVCPGVAFVVFGMFFVHGGFVDVKYKEKYSLVSKFSLTYWLMLSKFIIAQIITFYTMMVLLIKLFSPENPENKEEEEVPKP